MKLVTTKSECKVNVATKIKSPKDLKKSATTSGLSPVLFYSADNLIDELLFNRISFSERLTLRSNRDNKLFILENCSLYKNQTLALAAQLRH